MRGFPPKNSGCPSSTDLLQTVAVRDPNKPDTFLPGDEAGDHLHPNDAGYKVMGDAIDLKLFTRKPKR
jgi:lysophospholipase L1-like esterase